MTLHATPQATRRHGETVRERQRLPAAAYRLLGKTGLTTSALGFGGYRIARNDETHRRALEQALRRGVNLVDTSSNYTDGGSEALIGAVLAAGGEETRARTIVVSKVGYVQGRNMVLAREQERNGTPFPEMVPYNPSCWHCLHPRFLADQLTRTLERLGLDCLDGYLLHNPEYFLMDAKNQGAEITAARDEFHRRIGAAFGFMEEAASAGKIQWYGVSSNTFGEPPDAPTFVSLEALLEQAERVAAGGSSRFAVVQCPLNLFESGPALTPNQLGAERTFVSLAEEAGLAVLVNRPLNAIRGEGLERLADGPVPRPGVEQELAAALDDLAEKERAFAEEFSPALGDSMPAEAGPAAPFEWSVVLREALPALGTAERWERILEQEIYPRLQQGARFVQGCMTTDARRSRFAEWYPDYCRAFESVAGMVFEWLNRAAHARASALHQRLAPLLEGAYQGATLSQKALLPLLSLPGVTCVLNGVRRPTYVEDSLGAVALGALPEGRAEAILRAFRV